MRQSVKTLLISLFVLLNLHATAQLYDWRGPNRTGVYEEAGLLKKWSNNGPELLWEAGDLGMGYSSVCISGDAVYLTGRKDTMDVLTALDLNGTKLWEVSYGRSWIRTYSDSRCTPTYYNGNLYLISGSGDLVCVDEEGNTVWNRNHYKEFDAEPPRFGISECPLIVDEMVIASPGGNKASMAAYNVHTGDLVWQSEPLLEEVHYVNPLLVEHGGKKLIVSLTSNHIIGVDAKDGKLLWKVHYTSMNPETGKRRRKNHAITPIYSDGFVFVSSGYDHISVKLELSSDASSVKEVWKNEDIDPHHGGVVLIGNYLYSSNYENNSNGDWVCVDWTTGETQWVKEWYNKGSIIAADDMLYIYEEKSGHVGLVNPSPNQMQVISEFQVEKGSGPHWSHPVIRDGKLYIRHGEHLMVFNVIR